MNGFNILGRPRPKTLQQLVEEKEFFIRIIRELHPNSAELSIIVHAQIIKGIFNYLENFEVSRTGILYGRKDIPKGQMEISGFDVSAPLKNNIFHLDPSSCDKPIGRWVCLDKSVNDIYEFFKKLDKVGDLILLLPTKMGKLYSYGGKYGFYFRKDKKSSYNGPFGYLLFDKEEIMIPPVEHVSREFIANRIITPTGIKSKENAIHDVQTFNSSKSNDLGKLRKVDTVQDEKQKIIVDKEGIELLSIEQEKIRQSQQSRISNHKKIKIDREVYERYRNLDFLQDCEYHTPKDYNDIIYLQKEYPNKSSDSIFIDRDFLITLIKKQRICVRGYKFSFALFEGVNKTANDGSRVYQSKSIIGRICTSQELMHPQLTSPLWDSRGKYPLRFWCLFTRQIIFPNYSNFEIFSDALPYMEKNLTNIGLIINERKDPSSGMMYFDSESFDMCTFIKKHDAQEFFYVPRNQFYVYYKRK